MQPDLHVTQWGSGSPVLLVHGYSESGATSFKRLHDSHHHAFVCPDRRGYGRSAARTHEHAWESEADELAALIPAGAHILGASNGGLIALVLASRHPNVVRSLAVVEPPAFGFAQDVPDVRAVRQRLSAVFEKAASLSPAEFDELFDAALGFNHDPAPQSENVRRASQAAMNEALPWEAPIALLELANCSFPKLVVSGKWQEHVANPVQKSAAAAFDTVCQRLAQEIRGRYAVAGGALHAAQHSPDFSKLYDDFLIEADNLPA